MGAKLYFRYGTVRSAKSLNLLAVAHSYESQHKVCVVIKPKLENRFGEKFVGSRAGLKAQAHLVIDRHTHLNGSILPENTDCVLVDEAQFFTEYQINQLKIIVIKHKIPVIAYGLRTDSETKLFPGSKRLMEIADCIEEVKTVCISCNSKATVSAKVDNGNIIIGEPKISITADLYKPMCAQCFYNNLSDQGVEDLVFACNNETYAEIAE